MEGLNVGTTISVITDALNTITDARLLLIEAFPVCVWMLARTCAAERRELAALSDEVGA